MTSSINQCAIAQQTKARGEQVVSTIWDQIETAPVVERFCTLGAISVRALEIAAYDIAQSTEPKLASPLFVLAQELEAKLKQTKSLVVSASDD